MAISEFNGSTCPNYDQRGSHSNLQTLNFPLDASYTNRATHRTSNFEFSTNVVQKLTGRLPNFQLAHAKNRDPRGRKKKKKKKTALSRRKGQK